MAISQPTSSDKLANPDHSLSHRVVANDPSSPAMSITVDGSGDIRIAATSAQKIGFFGQTPVDQPAAVADATGAGDIVGQFNYLLARMRELGLIAT